MKGMPESTVETVEANCTLKNLVCSAHQIWCASAVQTGTRYMVCCAHLTWCVMHTIFGVENTLYSVLLHCILPRARFYTCKSV